MGALVHRFMTSRQQQYRALYGFACSGDSEYLRALEASFLGRFAADDTSSEIAVSLQSDIEAVMNSLARTCLANNGTFERKTDSKTPKS